MSWTAPMTAIAGSVFTAAQFNTFIRDNLNECPAAKATTPGSFFATSATNQIAERVPATALVATTETTSSTSFTDLATVGPTVTVTTGSSALIIITAQINNSTSSLAGVMAVDISGATTEAPSTTYQLRQESSGTSEFVQTSSCRFHTALTPGSNTFKAMYSVPGGVGQFVNRQITVIPY